MHRHKHRHRQWHIHICTHTHTTSCDKQTGLYSVTSKGKNWRIFSRCHNKLKIILFGVHMFSKHFPCDFAFLYIKVVGTRTHSQLISQTSHFWPFSGPTSTYKSTSGPLPFSGPSPVDVSSFGAVQSLLHVDHVGVTKVGYRKLSRINYTALQQLTEFISVAWLYSE